MALDVKEHEPLKLHTVFKIGGPARFFIDARTSDETKEAVRFAKEKGVPWIILGAGSNVLVSDQGFQGVVIHASGGAVRVAHDTLVVDAAVSMARAVAESLKAGLRGFEWAIGVPGSVGGSVRGNAGCFGKEIKDVLLTGQVYDAVKDTESTWLNKDFQFAYRDSAIKHHPECVVLSATIQLVPGDLKEGERLVREYTLHRTKSQDIGTSSAGCAFKNIPWERVPGGREGFKARFLHIFESGTVAGVSVGWLIDELGLRGRRIGGAKISERHGNFIINTGGATAEDVIMLIGIVKEYVHRTYGILLEEEIQYIGFE